MCFILKIPTDSRKTLREMGLLLRQQIKVATTKIPVYKIVRLDMNKEYVGIYQSCKYELGKHYLAQVVRHGDRTLKKFSFRYKKSVKASFVQNDYQVRGEIYAGLHFYKSLDIIYNISKSYMLGIDRYVIMKFYIMPGTMYVENGEEIVSLSAYASRIIPKRKGY